MLEYIFIIGVMLPLSVLMWGITGLVITCAAVHLRDYLTRRER